MIWIIGGTKDSRSILDEVLKVREDEIIVSTATEYGGKLLEDVAKNEKVHVLSERLNVLQIESMILEKKIDLIIDASHPYAQNISNTVISMVSYLDEKSARAAGEERAKRALMKQRQATQRVSLENLFDTLKAGELKSVNVIIKADVQGSVEALSASLQKIDVEGVKVTIVHSAVGAINESDVTLAEASNAFIVGFNVRPTPQARQQAEADDVEIRLHSIIYKVIEEMEEAMKGMLDPEFEEKVIGEAVIRETFKVSKVGTIGGFMVMSGKVTRDSKVRVIRDGVVIYDGELASLKHYKDDVKEVTNGREGGLMIEGYNDIKTDDVIEAYIMEEIKR